MTPDEKLDLVIRLSAEVNTALRWTLAFVVVNVLVLTTLFAAVVFWSIGH